MCGVGRFVHVCMCHTYKCVHKCVCMQMYCMHVCTFVYVYGAGPCTYIRRPEEDTGSLPSLSDLVSCDNVSHALN